MIVVALLLNTALTLLLDCINYVPSTTHRWALFLEGRLRLNTNPRLFTCARTFMPNAWYSNLMSAVALVFAYGGVSVLTYQIYVIGAWDKNSIGVNFTEVDGPRYGLDFNAWGFLGLGIGLSIQCILANWALVQSRFVPTWNSNPVGTAKACLYLNGTAANESYPPRQQQQQQLLQDQLQDKPTTAPRSRSDTFETTSTSPLSKHSSGLQISRPRTSQPALSKYEPKVRVVAYLIWILFFILSIWTIVVGIIAHSKGTTSPAYIEAEVGKATALGYWQMYGQVSIMYSIDAYRARRDWLGLIIQCIVLAGITLGLHCMELLTHASRDEAIWRRAATTGVNPEQGALLAGLSNWPCWLLFVFKSVTHWVFGYAFTTDCFAFMNLIPMIVLAFTFVLLGAFAEFMVRHRPSGPQPVTYGDVRRLVSLVDDWSHERIFWGDKGPTGGGIRKAGTAGQRLAELDMGAWYVDLRAETLSG
jgi:hypothetical protein